jgi:hypothetical protein
MEGLRDEPSSHQTALQRPIFLKSSCVESRIEGINWNYFLPEALKVLFRGPIKHRVVMHSEVVAQPDDNSVHLIIIISD